MTANMASSDRVLRALAGLALIGYGFFARGPWIWAAAAGAVLLLTAAVRFCPAYWMLRIRTLRRPA